MIDHLFIYLFIYLAPAECSILSSWSSRELRDAAEYTFISGTGELISGGHRNLSRGLFFQGGGGGSAPLWFWSPWKPKLLLIQRLSPSLYQTFVTKKSSRQWQGHFIFSSSVICMMYSNKTFLHPNSLILFIPNLLWFVRTWIRTQPWPWSCPVLTTVLYPIIRMGIRGH